MFGISLGTFYGNVKEGLGVHLDVFAAKGDLKLYMKDNALWVCVMLTAVWGGGIDIDQELFSLGDEE